MWSVDDLHDNDAMSKYATITSLSESPLVEGIIYAGSDDGLIHATADGGTNWQQAGKLPGIPARPFINDIEASLFDADTVFAVADAHKVGDFSPYVFVSDDRGRNWRGISGDLPDGTIAWAIQQDHEFEDLLFLGTEFGVYFTLNGGTNWHKLSGAPTIAFRDIKLQRRDNDLVGATFGRGFYILDDYTPLRRMAAPGFGEEPALFPIRDAWWYIPSAPSQAVGMPTLGSDSYRAPNPDFGATFTYFLDGPYQSAKGARQAREKQIREEGGDIPFPGWDRLTAESLESEPRLMVLVRDGGNGPVRWVEAINEAGTHRVSWDLRYPAPDAIDLSEPEFKPPWETDPQGPLAAPGRYSAQLYAIAGGEAVSLGAPQEFDVKPVRKAPDGTDYAEVAAFQQETAELKRMVANATEELGRTRDLLKHMKAAALEAPAAPPSLFIRLDAFEARLGELESRLGGDPVRTRLSESQSPSIAERAAIAARNWQSTHSPTETQKTNLGIAREDFAAFKADLESLLADDLVRLESELMASGAPSWR